MLNYVQPEGLVEYHPNYDHQSAIECMESDFLSSGILHYITY
nr:MAG TPA: hypothetical protein [Bacteriophage sp.]